MASREWEEWNCDTDLTRNRDSYSTEKTKSNRDSHDSVDDARSHAGTGFFPIHTMLLVFDFDTSVEWGLKIGRSRN